MEVQEAKSRSGMLDRWPGEESIDLYPGLVVSDGQHRRVSGSITVGRTRLPLWAFLPQTVREGWTEAGDYYHEGDEQVFGREAAVEFVAALLELRGEFGRLLLVLADAERRETRGGRKAWFATKLHRKRVRRQLERCIAVLDAQETS